MSSVSVFFLGIVLGGLGAIFLCEEAVIRAAKRADHLISFSHWGTYHWFRVTAIKESTVPKEPTGQKE